jgi:hypothetical protein
MPEHISRSSIMFAGAMSLAAFAFSVLTVGLTSSVSTGYRVGPYAPFGAGLAAVNVGVMLGVASGSLALHLWHMKDNTKQRQERSRDAAQIMEEIRRLRSEDTAQIMAEINRVRSEDMARIMNEIIGLRKTLEVVVQQLATLNEAAADEVSQQRRHGN